MNIDRRLFLGFMVGTLLLNAVILLLPWKEILKGRNDFPIFYSNALMVRDGKASGLYDFDAENSFTRIVTDVPRPPNNHLPYELLLFIPFTYLRFPAASILWMTLSLAMLAGVAATMRDLYPARWSFSWILLIILAFCPESYCLLQGQDSILLLFLFALSFWLWRRGNEGTAGFVLALGLFRPQLVLPFVFVVFLAGKWKLLRGFIPGTALVLALSTWVVGPHGMARYARVLLSQGSQQSAMVLEKQWEVSPGMMATWRGFLWVCLPRWVPSGVSTFLLFLGTFLALAWAARKMRAAKGPAALNLAFATALATVLLVSFHSNLNDFGLMILPLLTWGTVLAASPPPSEKSKYAIVTLGFLLFLTPLYYLLLTTSNVGWFFLVGLATLGAASRWANNWRNQGVDAIIGRECSVTT
jgi:Glycosyltransferase family 87